MGGRHQWSLRTHEEETQHRARRLRLHGPHAHERVSAGARATSICLFEPVLKAVSARNRQRLEAFASNWGYGSVESDWRELVERPDIDLVDIASPNDTHAEIAIAAARAGKMVMCEKPLARTVPEAEAMVSAVESAGVPNSVWYNYRRVPAIVLLRQLIEEGKLGRIFHYRAKFLQDWTISQELPQGGEGLWRLDAVRGRQRRDRGSAGALHRHGHVAERSDRRRDGDDRDVHQVAHSTPSRAESSRSRSTMRAPSSRGSATARWRRSSRRAMHAVIRRSTRSRSMASTPRPPGICTICIVCNGSIIVTKGEPAAGAASTSPTETTRT